jgi:hypothetical protein
MVAVVAMTFGLERMATMDRWLAIHMPLVWRARLHRSLFWSVLCALLAYASGLLASKAVPTDTELNVTSLCIWSFNAIAATAVLRSQLRIPLPDLSAARRLRLALINCVGVASLSLASPLLIYTVAHRIADACGDDELARDRAFHERHGFWLDSAALSDEVVAAHRAQLEESLARLGLHTNGRLFDLDVDGRNGHQKWLYVWNDGEQPISDFSREYLSDVAKHRQSTQLIKSRIESIAAGKQLLREHSGSYFQLCQLFSFLSLIWGVALVIFIQLRSLPGYRLGWMTAYTRVSWPRLSLTPRWLKRFDRRLLLGYPNLWATRLHVFLYYTLLVSVLVQAYFIYDGAWLRELAGSSFSLMVEASFCLAVWFAAGARSQRPEIAVTTWSEWRGLIGYMIYGMLPGVFLIGTALGAESRLSAMFHVVLACELLVLATSFLLRLYCTRWMTWTSLAMATGVTVVPTAILFVALNKFVALGIVWLSWYFGLRWVTRHEQPTRVSAWRSWLSACLINSSPGLLICSSTVLTPTQPIVSEGDHVVSENGHVVSAVTAAFIFLSLSFLVYMRLLWPAARVLLSARAQPRDQ